MPHIIVEYTPDSMAENSEKALLNATFEAVKSTGLFKTQNIKVRLHPIEFYQLGLENSGFIHVMCRIHPGKSADQKQQLTQQILSALNVSVQTVMKEKMGLVMTVEVEEMDRTKYAKVVL